MKDINLEIAEACSKVIENRIAIAYQDGYNAGKAELVPAQPLPPAAQRVIDAAKTLADAARYVADNNLPPTSTLAQSRLWNVLKIFDAALQEQNWPPAPTVEEMERPFTRFNEQELELIEIGRKWRADSSLENWFPDSAKHIADLNESNDELLRKVEYLHKTTRSLALERNNLQARSDNLLAKVKQLESERNALAESLKIISNETNRISDAIAL